MSIRLNVLQDTKTGFIPFLSRCINLLSPVMSNDPAAIQLTFSMTSFPDSYSSKAPEFSIHVLRASHKIVTNNARLSRDTQNGLRGIAMRLTHLRFSNLNYDFLSHYKRSSDPDPGYIYPRSFLLLAPISLPRLSNTLFIQSSLDCLKHTLMNSYNKF